MTNYNWVVLVYKIPPEPTKYRASVWREIKRLGGVYLQNGICIFPEIDDVSLNVSALASQIRNMGGSEYMFFTQSPTQEQANELVGLFLSARDEEYDELFEVAESLRARIDATSEFNDIQPLFDDMKKLKRQIGVVKSRDYFSARKGKQLMASLRDIQQTLRTLTEGGEL
jgi:hypothetical protein